MVLSIHILLMGLVGAWRVGEMEEDDVQPCKALQITKKMTDDTYRMVHTRAHL